MIRQILTAPNQLTLLRMIFLPLHRDQSGQTLFQVGAGAVHPLPNERYGLYGLLARTLHQQTLLGQISTPIADKKARRRVECFLCS